MNMKYKGGVQQATENLQARAYSELFDFFFQEHDLKLLHGQMDDIIQAIDNFKNRYNQDIEPQHKVTEQPQATELEKLADDYWLEYEYSLSGSLYSTCFKDAFKVGYRAKEAALNPTKRQHELDLSLIKEFGYLDEQPKQEATHNLHYDIKAGEIQPKQEAALSHTTTDIELVLKIANEYKDKFIDYWYDNAPPNMDREECKAYNARKMKDKIEAAIPTQEGKEGGVKILEAFEKIRKESGFYIWAFPITYRDKDNKVEKITFGWEVEWASGQTNWYRVECSTYFEALNEGIKAFQ